MTFAEGYSLTTRQVVLSTAYWLRAFRGGLAFIHDQHPSGGDVLTHHIEQQAAQYTGWLVCEDCSSELEFNRDVARALAARQQNPHDAGPVASREAAFPALFAWTQLYGSAPILSRFADVIVSVDQDTAAVRVLPGQPAGGKTLRKQPVLVGDTLAVTIADQVWMAWDLDVTSFRNGDRIPEVRLERCKSRGGHDIERVNLPRLTRPALFRSGSTLYNWYAVSDPRGLAPEGWHVPTLAEWEQLIHHLGGRETAGRKLKETGLYNGTDEVGFRSTSGGFVDWTGGHYGWGGTRAKHCYWTSTEAARDSFLERFLAFMRSAHRVELSNDSDSVWCSIHQKEFMLSVRCIRD